MSVLVEAGVDTWKPCWYLAEGSRAHRAMEALAMGGRGFARLLPEKIADHRVTFNPESRLVGFEGHPCSDGLARSHQLGDALAGLVQAAGDYGIELPADERGGFDRGERQPGFDGLGRMDVTADFACEPVEGKAILTGIAALDLRLPWDRVPRFERGHVNSVSYVSTRGVLARAYDKSIESRSGQARGSRVRLEGQYRWPYQHRRTVDELTGAVLCEKFNQRLAALGRACEGVSVMNRDSAVRSLVEKIEREEITPAQAERIIGYQLLKVAVDSKIPGMKRQTDYNRRRLVQEVGVVISSGVTDDVEVDVHQVFEQIDAEAFA